MRRLIAFPCAGETLVGSLDEAPGRTGLLIVSGGNEVRMGAHRGMALLAQRISEAGHPVFRFDRRGIGDSTGENRGYLSSADDIAAAARIFREAAGVEHIVACGNCDAATALAFFHASADIDALVLANPWAVEPADDLPPPAAIRARYAARMRDPRQWLRLLRGGVDMAKLFKGLSRVANKESQENGLAVRLQDALDTTRVPLTILLARGDNTAIAFAAAIDTAKLDVRRLDSASHSFAHASDKDWLFEQVVAAIKAATGKH